MTIAANIFYLCVFFGSEYLVFIVQDCKKSFRSQTNLQQHIRNHSSDYPYVCDVCGKAFKQPGRLNHHRKGHFQEYRWPCSYCSEKFKSLFSYKNHLAKTHPEMKKEIEESTNIKLFQCSICTRMFGDKEDLVRHTYIHKNEKPFKCSHCGKGFNDRSNLRQHERTHVGEKKHVCDICQKPFIQKRDLRSHKYSCERKHQEFDLEKSLEGQGEIQVMNVEEADMIANGYDTQTVLPTMMETFASDSKPVIVEQVKQVFKLY